MAVCVVMRNVCVDEMLWRGWQTACDQVPRMKLLIRFSFTTTSLKVGRARGSRAQQSFISSVIRGGEPSGGSILYPRSMCRTTSWIG
jgi:hypothetical protein